MGLFENNCSSHFRLLDIKMVINKNCSALTWQIVLCECVFGYNWMFDGMEQNAPFALQIFQWEKGNFTIMTNNRNSTEMKHKNESTDQTQSDYDDDDMLIVSVTPTIDSNAARNRLLNVCIVEAEMRF